MLRPPFTLARCLTFVSMVACTTACEVGPDQEDTASTLILNSAYLVAPLSEGSAVYLGEGYYLTNWNKCVAYAHEESFTIDDYAYLINDPGDGTEPRRKGAPLTDRYCMTQDEAGHRSYTRDKAERTDRDCELLSKVWSHELQFVASTQKIPSNTPKRIAYANMALELCVVKFGRELGNELDAELERITLAKDPVKPGQKVIVSGTPTAFPSHVDSCEVLDTPVPVLDRDRGNPLDTPVVVVGSDLDPANPAVKSFRVACPQVHPDMAGAPVLDAESGALLGLFWATDQRTRMPDRAASTGYVTPVSEWVSYLAQQKDRTAHSELARMLDTFGAK